VNHPKVPHPRELIESRTANKVLGWNDVVLDWLADHLLASRLMFNIALILPLIVLSAPDSVKITLGVFSGSWIQWWALPALQRQAKKGETQRMAKADADHEALTHIALTVDKLLAHKDKETK